MTQEQFRELFEQHFEAVRRYLFYRSGDEVLSTDLAQETFLRIWEKQLGPGHGNFRGLLFKIAGDMFVSHYRREQKMSVIRLNLKPGLAGASPEEQVMFKELKESYETALARLPEKQRIVFLMSRLDQLKYHEIADRLGISVKAVEKRMNLALSFLKNAIRN
jgi:RNA polymerase sigma-70 factor (ECF subfamily)